MSESRRRSDTWRVALNAVLVTLVGGCTSFGPPVASPAFPSLHDSGVLGLSPRGGPSDVLDGIISAVLDSRRAAALRTDDLPLPVGRSTAGRRPSGVNARSGALVGGLIGVSEGLLYRDVLGRGLEASERVLAILWFGTLGSVSGALIGSLGDPEPLLWPLDA